jgi:amino acid permease
VSKRSNALLLLTSTIIYPLISLRNLASLAPFSLLGLGGTFYTSVFMLLRLMDGTYAAGGRFFKDVAAPLFDLRGAYRVDQKMFVLLSMLSTSYIAHYGAPAFYHQMKDNTMKRFNTMVASAFGLAVVMFCFVMSTGFLTFGGATAGFVLNNYSGLDKLATVARCAIGVALVTGYPFVFSALRDGAMDVAGLKGESREKQGVKYTVGLIGAITSLALVLKDVGFVVSLSGALLGCPLMFMVPTAMNIGAVKNKAKTLGRAVTKVRNVHDCNICVGYLHA